MIFGNIKDKNQFDILCENLDYKKVMEFLKKNEFDDKEYPLFLDGNIKIMKNEIITKEADANSYEAHRKFSDVHFVIDGVEEMYIAPVDKLNVTKEYDDKNDCLFGSCDFGQKVVLHKGDYCIVFPEDAHKPGCGQGNKLIKFCCKVPANK